ncbi:MAG TPA: sigma-70 family RNA polymerase sigma factor [Solirubrobacteraceae bacterium]|nr:sigma-70 family RNA polymerase sigma factor [Solirubrobacteraceae bacterium]
MATPFSDQELVDRLRAGDENAFAELVGRYHRLMLRVARGYVRTDAVAEEVVQEAWLAVVRGIERFEGRSSFKTWLLRIVANRAMTSGAKEARSVPVEPSVSADHFVPEGEPGAGAWSTPPEPWPEDQLLAEETRAVIDRAIEELPPLQGAVVAMRDIEGLSSEEVQEALDISAVNQRVLLHRGRQKVREALNAYLSPVQ